MSVFLVCWRRSRERPGEKVAFPTSLPSHGWWKDYWITGKADTRALAHTAYTIQYKHTRVSCSDVHHLFTGTAWRSGRLMGKRWDVQSTFWLVWILLIFCHLFLFVTLLEIREFFFILTNMTHLTFYLL